MYSVETQQKLLMWREKVRSGTLSIEEQREAIQALRQDRMRAAATSTKARTTKAKEKKVVDSDDLLKGLEDL